MFSSPSFSVGFSPLSSSFSVWYPFSLSFFFRWVFLYSLLPFFQWFVFLSLSLSVCCSFIPPFVSRLFFLSFFFSRLFSSPSLSICFSSPSLSVGFFLSFSFNWFFPLLLFQKVLFFSLLVSFNRVFFLLISFSSLFSLSEVVVLFSLCQ